MKAQYKQRPLEQLATFLGLLAGGFGLFGNAYYNPVGLEPRHPTLAQMHEAERRVNRFNVSRCWRPAHCNDSRARRRKRRFDGNGRRIA